MPEFNTKFNKEPYLCAYWPHIIALHKLDPIFPNISHF